MSEVYFNPIWDVRMTDTSLRDGSHHKRHQFTEDEVGAIVAALDTAGRPGHRGHPRRRPRRIVASTTASPKPPSRS